MGKHHRQVAGEIVRRLYEDRLPRTVALEVVADSIEQYLMEISPEDGIVGRMQRSIQFVKQRSIEAVPNIRGEHYRNACRLCRSSWPKDASPRHVPDCPNEIPGEYVQGAITDIIIRSQASIRFGVMSVSESIDGDYHVWREHIGEHGRSRDFTYETRKFEKLLDALRFAEREEFEFHEKSRGGD